VASKFRRSELKGVALIAAGFALVALVVAGYVIGAAVDRHFGVGPRWAVVGLIAGFIVGFWDMYVIASRILTEQPKITRVVPPEEWDEPETPEEE
jgi:F0F1-type ATP synthase assembly protein I